jgi:hypothetical protein
MTYSRREFLGAVGATSAGGASRLYAQAPDAHDMTFVGGRILYDRNA